MLTIRVVLSITIKSDVFVPGFAYILFTYIPPCNYNYRPIGHVFCVRWEASLGIDDPRPSQNSLSRDRYHIPEFSALNRSGLGLKATKVVSNPRYMLVDIIYKRAKPLLTCVGPKCERKGLHSRLPRRSKKGSRHQSDQSAR